MDDAHINYEPLGSVYAFTKLALTGKTPTATEKTNASTTYHFLLRTLFRLAQSSHGSGARSGSSVESSY